jgi:hypothetical protein
MSPERLVSDVRKMRVPLDVERRIGTLYSKVHG